MSEWVVIADAMCVCVQMNVVVVTYVTAFTLDHLSLVTIDVAHTTHHFLPTTPMLHTAAVLIAAAAAAAAAAHVSDAHLISN